MEDLPVVIPPALWWISLIANLILLPGSYWLWKSYLPAKLEQQKKKLDADLVTAADEREYKQATENVAIDILKESVEERSRELTELTRILEHNTETTKRGIVRDDNLADAVRVLAGIIDKKLTTTKPND